MVRSPPPMKLSILSLLFLGIWGCTTPVPNELNYRGQLPSTTAIRPETIEQFAARLADATGLGKSSEVQSSLPIIELTASANRDIVVTIMGDKSTNALLMTVAGKIQSDRAKSIAGAIESLFGKMYPDGKLAPYERKGGLFGP